MKLSLLLLFSIQSVFSYSQEIEISATPIGIANYSKIIGVRNLGFSAPERPYMVNALYKQNWKKKGEIDQKMQWGLGISYVTYGGTVRDKGNENWYPPRGYYRSKVHVVGAELTPIIRTFGKNWNIRSGLFAGAIVAKEFIGEESFSPNTSTINGPYASTTIVEDVPESRLNNLLLHWNSRLGYTFAIGRMHVTPFIQVSLGVFKELTTLNNGANSYRGFFGLTFEINNER